MKKELSLRARGPTRQMRCKMIEQHYSGWDYYAVQDLEEMCRVLPEKVLEALRQGQRE